MIPKKKKDIPLKYQKKGDSVNNEVKRISNLVDYDEPIVEKKSIPKVVTPIAEHTQPIAKIQEKKEEQTSNKEETPTTSNAPSINATSTETKASKPAVRQPTQRSKANEEFAKMFSFRSEAPAPKPVEPVQVPQFDTNQYTEVPGFVPGSDQGGESNYVDPNQQYMDEQQQYYQYQQQQSYQQQQQSAPPPAFFGRNQREMANANFVEIRQDDFRGSFSQFQLQNRDTTNEMNTFSDLMKRPQSENDLVIPSRDSRRQHQVTYLLWEAKQKAAEIESKRATGYRNAKEARAKYGW